MGSRLPTRAWAWHSTVVRRSDTSISFSGYVKGDFYLDNRNDRSETFNVAAIGLEDEEDAADDYGAVGMHARQSRIRFDTHTPTGMGR